MDMIKLILIVFAGSVAGIYPVVLARTIHCMVARDSQGVGKGFVFCAIGGALAAMFIFATLTI